MTRAGVTTARALAWLVALGAWPRACGVAALFVAIVAADAATGLDLTLRSLYLIPVSAGAWSLGWRSGAVVSVLSVAVSSYYDVAFGLARTHASFVYSDALVRFTVYLAAVALLARLKRAQAQLREMAQTDALTGLYNRRGFGLLVAREIERARRTAASLTLVHLDLDGFKALNDARGHATGDDALVAVAQVLDSSRAVDIASRLGGDEFALLLPDTASTAAATVVGRLVERLEAAMAAHGWPLTFSVGVAVFRAPDRSLDEMLSVVDALTYDVKRAGKHGVRYREIDPVAPPRGA